MIALAPGGRLLDESYVQELAAEPALTLLCGRYEGFDERIVEHLASESLSVGRYVLSGGEPAAMVLCDSILRKLPGALGHVDSAVEESFSEALEGEPEYPHYTRPAEYRGWRVPEILLSGHHERIREWRLQQSRARGAERAIGLAEVMPVGLWRRDSICTSGALRLGIDPRYSYLDHRSVYPPAPHRAVFATIRERVGQCSDFRSLDAFFLP